MADNRGPLPPGWEEKHDYRTGKSYYINHVTRATTWENPRERYQQIGQPVASNIQQIGQPVASNIQQIGQPVASNIQNKKEEFVPMQDLGGNRPVSPKPMQQEATTYNSNLSHVHGSDILSKCLREKKAVELIGLEQPGLNGMLGFLVHFDSEKGRWKVDVEGRHMLIKPQNIQPGATASHSTIVKEQVASTSEVNHVSSARQAGQIQYLKSVFPTADEYLLLDVLTNSQNNVQMAVDRLAKMGCVKKEVQVATRIHVKKEEEEERTTLPKQPSSKTDKEKEDLRKKLKNTYEEVYDIPERILYMALESVLYDEKQANNLIMTMIQDDLKRQKHKDVETAKNQVERKKSPKVSKRIWETQKPTSRQRKANETDHSNTDEISMPGISRRMKRKEEGRVTTFQSTLTSLAKGPNAALRKGPNDDLLLTDYIAWNGPNPDLRNGPNTCLAKGPQGHQTTGSRSLAKGPAGLAKGTMYFRLEEDQQNRNS